MIPNVISRCVYTFGQEFFNQPPSYRIALQADFFCFCYLFIRLPYIYYTVHWNNKPLHKTGNTTEEQMVIIFNPGLHCLTHLNALLLMILLLLELFHIISKVSMARADIRLPCWRFWKEVFVSLQDHYFSCKLRGDVRRMAQEKKANQMRQKLSTLFPSFLLPKWVLKQFARLQLWLSFENIDQRRFYALAATKLTSEQTNTLSRQPQLSDHIKRRAVLMLLAYDKIAFGGQLIIGSDIAKYFIF